MSAIECSTITVVRSTCANCGKRAEEVHKGSYDAITGTPPPTGWFRFVVNCGAGLNLVNRSELVCSRNCGLAVADETITAHYTTPA